MNESPFQREFYLKIDNDCQDLIDSCYKMISKLNYYENDCGFAMFGHVKKFKATIFNMLKNYEEN